MSQSVDYRGLRAVPFLDMGPFFGLDDVLDPQQGRVGTDHRTSSLHCETADRDKDC